MRNSDSITDIVAQIERNFNEAKEYQFFGGDALVVNELDEALTETSNVDYILTLTPERENSVLVSSLGGQILTSILNRPHRIPSDPFTEMTACSSG